MAAPDISFDNTLPVLDKSVQESLRSILAKEFFAWKLKKSYKNYTYSLLLENEAAKWLYMASIRILFNFKFPYLYLHSACMLNLEFLELRQ